MCELALKELFCDFFFSISEAYDPLDPNGNITIRWDVMSWTPDGYVVSTVPLFLLVFVDR